MNSTRTVLAVGAVLAVLSGTAVARDHIRLGIGFGVPGRIVVAPAGYGYYAPPPVYYAPPPAYYYAPAPAVYYGPRPAYYVGAAGYRGWGGHHRGRR